MPPLLATDVTIVLDPTITPNPLIVARERKTYCLISFGNGTKTYPSGGVPMPAIGQFGMVRNLHYIDFLLGPPGMQGFYNPLTNKLILYSHRHVLNVAEGASADAAAARVQAAGGLSPDLWISQPSGGGGALPIPGRGWGDTSNVGGIVDAAPGSLVEISSVPGLPAVQFYALAVGW